MKIEKGQTVVVSNKIYKVVDVYSQTVLIERGGKKRVVFFSEIENKA